MIEECAHARCTDDREPGSAYCDAHQRAWERLNQDPPFDRPLWLSVESKLGRALTPEENERIYRMGAMRKEWFFGEVKVRDREGVERLVATCHLSIVGKPKPWSFTKWLWSRVFG